MKKAISIFLSLALALSLAACGDNSKPAAGSAGGSGGAVTSSTAAPTTDFPKNNITMIIPQGLGGGSDLIARTVASELEKVLGVTVICENVEGGSTSLGLQRLADSQPDGYTICMTMTNLSMLSTLGYSELTCDDFESICSVNYDAATIMIRTDDSRYSNFEELIAYATDHPGELNWGTGAAGGMWHLAILTLCKATGIDVNIVPNAGGGTGVGLALANGDIDVAVFSPVDTMAQIDSGEIVPVMSMTEERMAAFPNVPTAAECGYEITTLSTRGYLAPKGTPAEVIDVLEDAFQKAVESDTYTKFIEGMASNIFWLGSQDYYDFMKGEVDQYVPILLESGLVTG